ncbi:unnamed protein product [Meganyctiphanes norvegica]|uniref:Reverse transcriptase domain-containing protein n=1 Tax=Meganyctiphanes norvegica TaxID=48144 RepID=A0AAV2RHM1_MEGNR
MFVFHPYFTFTYTTISEEEDVTSGVRQGTELAAVLFVIMLSDIDEKVKNCIIRSFVDDTHVNKNINSEEDKRKMQEDLECIFKWERKNMMKFNENKFEQIKHGASENAEVEPYMSPNG